MRKAAVYRNGELAGVIIEDDNRHYTFSYDENYFLKSANPGISLTLPKTKKEYNSETLFPFFFNMISEGVNKKLQSKTLHIDERDYFGFLLATAIDDTIGAITIEPIAE